MRSWYRNGFYHRHLLRQVPPGARRALDVGCGTGEFAARVAALVPETTGIDVSTLMVDYARARYDGVRGLSFRAADITRIDLSPGQYDYISCLASIHHMPFEPVLAALRDALSPGGVLVVLGLYRTQTVTDRLITGVAVPANLLVSAVSSVRGGRTSDPAPPRHPVRPPAMGLAEIRVAAGHRLPGVVVRRHLFWRYSLVYRHANEFGDRR